MLARPLHRALRRATTSPLTHPAHICACQCGVTFQQHGVARRHRQTMRPAPSTFDRQARVKPHPDDAPYQKLERDFYKASLRYEMHRYAITGKLKATKLDCEDFLDAFDELSNARVQRAQADPRAFAKLLQEHGLSDLDGFTLSMILLRISTPEARDQGKRLLMAMSRHGYADATLKLMHHAQMEYKQKPAVFNSPQLKHAKAHLAELAAQPGDFRAMVLQGLIAHRQGHEDRAIALWTSAMDSAIAASEARTAKARKANSGESSDIADDPLADDSLQLASPWIELFRVHFSRYRRGLPEYQQAEHAAKVGCAQDDPTSHYLYSQLIREDDEQGHVKATSEWLFHVTKAAASSHPRAAWELADWYIHCGWPFLNDEPKPEVKPTPYDRYPVAGSVITAATSLLRMLGVLEKPQQLEPQESLFHTSFIPSTAEERWKLALAWLGVGWQSEYAPSHLLAAQVYTEKEIWYKFNVPANNLNLASSRYHYKSEADFEANYSLKSAAEQTEIDDAISNLSYPGENHDIPNRLHSPSAAKWHLRQVFYAYQAWQLAQKLRAPKPTRRARRANEEEEDEQELDESQLKNQPYHVRKWFRFPDTRESYEAEMPAMRQVACRICDEHGWDLFGEDGGLVYKAQVKR